MIAQDKKPRAARSDRTRILIFAPHTMIATGRSGIHRVAMRLIENLAPHASVTLIKWDDIEGQPRYCDRSDIRRYFRTSSPPRIAIHPAAHKVDYRFSETIDPDERVILLMPEPFYLCTNGNEIYSRLLAQAIANGWTTAAIFYDLIPLKCPGYVQRDAQARYMAELARVDIVIPISKFVEDDLRRHLAEVQGVDAAALRRVHQTIGTVVLPDRDAAPPAAESGKRANRKSIVLLGTVETRKQQLRVVRAFQRTKLGERTGLRMVIIGDVNPSVAVEFKALIANDPHIQWLGAASDSRIDEAFSHARFSVFASNEEGFGLPIVESLCRNVPCLTANTGAMKEVADGGGCLTVDVSDDAAIETGLERLALDDECLKRCHEGIKARRWRTWSDYASAVLALVCNYETPKTQAKAIATSVVRELSKHYGKKASRRTHWTFAPVELAPGLERIVVNLVKDGFVPEDEASDDEVRIALVGGAVDAAHLPQDAFDAITEADAWFCLDRSTYEAVIARAAASGADGLMSGSCGWRAEPEPLAALMTQKIEFVLERHIRCRVSAARDEHYRSAWKSLAVPSDKALLTLVISAYNGAGFIERSVEHCLELIKPLGGRVALAVADNASTDDTRERVARFVERGDLEYIFVTCNTGLLGNLHLVSTLVRSRHVWMIGVDDIVMPDALERILAVLAEDPACPFVLPNFSVYHRETMADVETCKGLIADSRVVEPNCRGDGFVDVRDAVSQHDNLLTAFYIIIFRSDLMAAVFNSPFTAPFFGSLIDTIPTTKVILEAFPNFAAYWLAEPAVVGNAHNSWRHHRVAWHGILMPLAFELAREAGLDRHKLRRWARQHVDLLAEAESLFPNPGVAETFPAEALEASFRVFGKRLLA